MSYMKHKVNLPQDLEDLADGDGASAIYIGDTKIIPTNIGGLGQRVRKPGIPYWLDQAVKEWLGVWSNINDTNDYLTILANIPSSWTNYWAITSTSATGTSRTNGIGDIFNATGMTPWGMGTLNDGWGYESDYQNRFDVTKNPSGDIWTELSNMAEGQSAQCRFTVTRGGGWWSAGSSSTDKIRQTYARRVLYRLAAFEAGLFMDHPQSLWTTVLTDSQIGLLVSTISNLIGGTGLSDYHWVVDDASLGTLSLNLHGGLTHSAKISELFTDPTLQPLGEPRTVWDYRYSTSGTEVFNIQKSFNHKSLVDGDSIELSDALKTTHQVIWLTPEIAFSDTGTVKIHYRGNPSYKRGYIEAKWMLDPQSGSSAAAANVNGGTADMAWEDTFLVSVTHSMGTAPVWDRLIVGWRSKDSGVLHQISEDSAQQHTSGSFSYNDRAIGIGIIVPKDHSDDIFLTMEVTRDNILDPHQPTKHLINSLW